MKTRDEGHTPPVLRPGGRGVCIVMACADMSEAGQVSRQLLEFNAACLVTYRRAEDLMHNAPSGKVALVILSTQDQPPMIRRTLRWLRLRWPKCPVTVVGDAGSGEHEMTARKGGASYLVRPVRPQQWSALLRHALAGAGQVDTEVSAR